MISTTAGDQLAYRIARLKTEHKLQKCLKYLEDNVAQEVLKFKNRFFQTFEEEMRETKRSLGTSSESRGVKRKSRSSCEGTRPLVSGEHALTGVFPSTAGVENFAGFTEDSCSSEAAADATGDLEELLKLVREAPFSNSEEQILSRTFSFHSRSTRTL